MAKRLLITGGGGFIARHLCERLGPDYDIQAPKRQELDLMDAQMVMEHIEGGDYDTVIHCATYDAAPAHSKKDPTRVLENNLRMFVNITRCDGHYEKMVYYGSGAEFSREHWMPKMGESFFDAHVPKDQYGLSKYVMTKYAQSADNVYNLRLFATFGKYEDWKVRIISSLIRDAVLDRPMSINQNRSYDFLDVADLCRITKWFIDNDPEGSVYNVCSGTVVDFVTIAKMINDISGKDLDIIVGSDETGIEYSGDNSLLVNELGGFEFTPLKESIKELYQWNQNHLEDIDG